METQYPIAMITMTWPGYLMSSFYPNAKGISLFGIMTVPDITQKSEYWSGVFHEIHAVANLIKPWF